jgi:hypothetical protein
MDEKQEAVPHLTIESAFAALDHARIAVMQDVMASPTPTAQNLGRLCTDSIFIAGLVLGQLVAYRNASEAAVQQAADDGTIKFPGAKNA